MDENRLSAIKARVSAATPGPWEVTEIRDGRQPEGVEELGVFAPCDVRSYQKPDETWHGALICRGMDGPTRAANAAFIAYAREDVRDLVAEVDRIAPALCREPTQEEGDAAEGITPPDCPTPIGAGECFVRAGGWTGRRCRVCRRWAWGGPTLCERCAATPEVERLTACSAERDAAERTHASAYAGAVSRREEAREACAVLCDAIYTERDDAARRRRTHGSRETRDEDCLRLAGQAQGAAMCAGKIREGGA